MHAQDIFCVFRNLDVNIKGREGHSFRSTGKFWMKPHVSSLLNCCFTCSTWRRESARLCVFSMAICQPDIFRVIVLLLEPIPFSVERLLPSLSLKKQLAALMGFLLADHRNYFSTGLHRSGSQTGHNEMVCLRSIMSKNLSWGDS